ncbi:MAG: hypothetical protein IPH07_07965 [Deltaproteobacteria bacterium]|nr:hypothetical protein [Deltaproteobacteria bacterium]MBK8236676.1 hypothetical protein [Deltaproteobacteria bacterium]MBK8717699.1 hypothetical protein [Deltaproteobacteria bacterium]MBP7288749.1 hypothetical protein [Nannocystaceae bacterium]
MRIAGFIIAILGALAAGLLGAAWLTDAAEQSARITQAKALGVDTGALDSIVTAAYVLVLSLGLGIAGGVFTLRGKGRIAALVLIAAGVAPALFAAKALVFTWLLVLAGLLSLGVKPREVRHAV